MRKAHLYPVFLLFGVILITQNGFSQTVERQVFSAFGGINSSTAYKHSVTLGEPVSATSYGVPRVIHGFEQPYRWVFVGTDEVSSEKWEVKAWPNPTGGFLNVQLPKGTFEAGVFNTEGKMVAQPALRAGQQTIDLSHLPPGLYLLRIGNQSDQSFQTLKLQVL